MISKERIDCEVDKVKKKAIAYRRDFHSNPELGYKEERTSSIIKSFLDDLGIEYYSSTKTGIIATIYGKNPNGPTIGIRADMDALPITDKKLTSYASKVKGVMHACGHDAHTAILMGTSEALNNLKDDLLGNVRLIFQPAEETDGGAKQMIADGALKDPDVSCVIGLHMDENIDSGCIGIKYGVLSAASNPFELTIEGRGAHGAYPHKGVDAIYASALMITALQSIISREIDPLDSAVITIGKINGGEAQNAICNEVVLSGIIRTLDMNVRKLVLSRMEDVVSGITHSIRCEYRLNITESYPCLENNTSVVNLIKNAAIKQIGEEKVINMARPGLGVDDFAYFGQHVPSAYFRLGSRNVAKGIIHTAHSSLFDIDEDSIEIGIKVYCQAVVDFLSKGL